MVSTLTSVYNNKKKTNFIRDPSSKYAPGLGQSTFPRPDQICQPCFTTFRPLFLVVLRAFVENSYLHREYDEHLIHYCLLSLHVTSSVLKRNLKRITQLREVLQEFGVTPCDGGILIEEVQEIMRPQFGIPRDFGICSDCYSVVALRMQRLGEVEMARDMLIEQVEEMSGEKLEGKGKRE